MTEVLVAEASRTLTTLIRLTLSPAGYRLRFVASGREALRLVRLGGVDLLILDAGLADLSGYEVVEALRAAAATARVAVLLTHNDYDVPDRRRISRARIDDVLTKPFERQALLERVRALAPAAVSGTVAAMSERVEPLDPAVSTPDPLEALSGDSLADAVDAAVARATAELGPRLDAMLAERLEQALDSEVRKLVKSKAESIVWKAVGELAEDLIREEITRLTQGDSPKETE